MKEHSQVQSVVQKLGGVATATQICHQLMVDDFEATGILPKFKPVQILIQRAIEAGAVQLNPDWSISNK